LTVTLFIESLVCFAALKLRDMDISRIFIGQMLCLFNTVLLVYWHAYWNRILLVL